VFGKDRKADKKQKVYLQRQKYIRVLEISKLNFWRLPADIVCLKLVTFAQRNQNRL
jgi:hypothetical protein